MSEVRNTSDTDILYGAAEISAYLSELLGKPIKRKLAYYWIAKGRIPAGRIGENDHRLASEDPRARRSDRRWRSSMQVVNIPLDEISTEGRLRDLNQEKVKALAESIKLIGLQTPISVADTGDDIVPLIAGRHRLEAVRLLGWETIPCIMSPMDEIDRRLWEISENLHRAELTTLERAEHIAEWVRLTEAKQEEERAKGVSGQVVPKLSARGRDGEGRPEGGINAAARELNIGPKEAQRATVIDSLKPEAKAAAVAAGLDNNQSALLEAAKEKEAEEQVKKLQERAAKRDAPKPPRQKKQEEPPKPAAPPANPTPTTAVIRPDANLNIWRFVLARITDPSDVSELSGMVATTYSEATQRTFARALAEKIPPEEIKRLSSNDQNYWWIFNGPTAPPHELRTNS